MIKAEVDLKIQFNMRVDNILRFYTVLNIPQELIDEPYNFRKSDIDAISRNYIREFSNQLSLFLNSRNLTELYELYDMEKVDKYSYLLVFGYSLFNTKRIINSLVFFWLPFVTISAIITILTYFLIK